jgi:hypothetical protein
MRPVARDPCAHLFKRDALSVFKFGEVTQKTLFPLRRNVISFQIKIQALDDIKCKCNTRFNNKQPPSIP